MGYFPVRDESELAFLICANAVDQGFGHWIGLIIRYQILCNYLTDFKLVLMSEIKQKILRPFYLPP